MTAQNFKPFLAPRNKVPSFGASRDDGDRGKGKKKEVILYRKEKFSGVVDRKRPIVEPLLLLFEGYVRVGEGVLTITAVVGVAMMNCTDRLSCDKCQTHFYTTVPGEWSILISIQPFNY
jgi:hypothetical protein